MKHAAATIEGLRCRQADHVPLAAILVFAVVVVVVVVVVVAAAAEFLVVIFTCALNAADLSTTPKGESAAHPPPTLLVGAI